MINSLKTAFSLIQSHRVAELFVSREVFIAVLAESKMRGGSLRVSLNQRYDSSRYKFLNKVCWNGSTFICLANDSFASDVRPISI